MPLRTGKLHFECIKCHRKFPRWGKEKQCPKCRTKAVKISRRVPQEKTKPLIKKIGYFKSGEVRQITLNRSVASFDDMKTFVKTLSREEGK